LVGCLLSVFREEHDPAYVEGRIDVVVAAMHVERVFGEGASGDFEDHCAHLSGSVIVLLDAVDDSLSGCEIDRSLAGNRLCDRATLSGVLTFALDGDCGSAENIELTFRSSELVHLTHLG
jgi:hypothetical protein